MAVVEYKLHAVGINAQGTPHWVKDGGYWSHPTDHSLVGWVPDNPEFWVPDTVTTLDRAAFIARHMAIHAISPFTLDNADPEADPVNMTDSQAQDAAGAWFDAFHAVDAE